MQQKSVKRVVIGGTFDILHPGHKVFLKKAFSLGEVMIGLTSDKMAQKIKKRKVNAFSARKRALSKFISQNFPTKFKIIKIEDKFGFALDKDFDFIVVSPETYPNAVLINKKRRKIKKKPIKIVKIKFVLGRDGKPISCTNIRKNRSQGQF